MPVSISPKLAAGKAADVAECGQIAQMISNIDSELSTITSAPDVEIEQRYIKISDALKKDKGERLVTLRAVEKARRESGTLLFALSREAVKSSADLFLVLAVQSRNPKMIAVATGADMLIDTADFVIQVVEADGPESTEKAAWVYFEDRWAMAQTLVSGPGKAFSGKQLEITKAVVDVMLSLGEAVINESQLKARLDRATAALEAIELSLSGLPVNVSETRKFLIDSLNAERRILSLLQTEYSSTNCQVQDILP